MEKGLLTPENAGKVLSGEETKMFLMRENDEGKVSTPSIIATGIELAANSNGNYISNVAQTAKLHVWVSQGLENFSAERSEKIVAAAEQEIMGAKVLSMAAEKADERA